MLFNVLSCLLVAMLAVIVMGWIFEEWDMKIIPHWKIALFIWVIQLVAFMWVMSWQNWWR